MKISFYKDFKSMIFKNFLKI